MADRKFYWARANGVAKCYTADKATLLATYDTNELPDNSRDFMTAYGTKVLQDRTSATKSVAQTVIEMNEIWADFLKGELKAERDVGERGESLKAVAERVAKLDDAGREKVFETFVITMDAKKVEVLRKLVAELIA